MSLRLFGAFSVIALTAVLSTALDGQTKSWTATRTSDGQPDLQGYWTNATFTPLERPAEFAGKEFLSDAEAAAFEAKKTLEENSQPKDDIHYDNAIWQNESYDKGVTRQRTSIVYDPADGKLPTLTPAGQQRVAAIRRSTTDNAESRALGERCISRGNEGPPMLGANYNANLQILQGREFVAIRHEMIHGTRLIPFDGRPHLPASLRQLGGDSRGRWEGATLVVDTTNFTDTTNFRAPTSMGRQDIIATRNLHVVERFTRLDAQTILYRFTVEDPTMWTRPWSGELVMRKWDGPIYEYACHEGNYGLGFILGAARAQENAAASGPQSPK
ncbi:MAG: hypothetical protein ABJA98_25865 [Acidobacteriota bacterium]